MAKAFQVDSGGTLLTNLVAYFKLEDVTEFYIGGGTFDLTNENTVAFNAGKVNNAADGGSGNTNKALQILNNLGINGGNCSISAWIKLTDSISTVKTLLGNAGGSSGVGYEFEYDGTTLTANRYRNGNSDNNASETIALSTGVWYHIVMTYDGTTLRLYRNNVAKGTNNTSGTGTALTAKFVVFKNPTADVRYFSGLVDEIGVWSKALSTTEISDLYNSGNGQTMTDQVDLSVNLSDSVTVSESVTTVGGDLNPNINDAVTVTENIATGGVNLGDISVFDLISLSEYVEVGNPFEIFVSEDITVSEAVMMDNSQLGDISVSESITVSDVITVTTVQIIKRGFIKMRSSQQSYPIPMDDTRTL